jgi:hypothetical protein
VEIKVKTENVGTTIFKMLELNAEENNQYEVGVVQINVGSYTEYLQIKRIVLENLEPGYLVQFMQRERLLE